MIIFYYKFLMGNTQSQQPQPRRIIKKPLQKPLQRPLQKSVPSVKMEVPQTSQPQVFVRPPTKQVGDLMPRPQATKLENANIMNVNDRVEQFKRNMKEEEANFLGNLEKAKEQFYKKQKTQEQQFQDELSEFEKRYNPFRILHLDYNATEDDVKKAYKKFSLKYHPDRPNGNGKKFMMVSQAYVYLMQKIKEMRGNSSHKELRDNAKRYFEEMEQKRQEMHIEDRPEDVMEIGEKNFDADKFNKIFEKNRMPTQWDRGYGDGWEDEKEDNIVMNSKFTIDLFNQTFNDVKQKKMEKKGTQVMKIDAPEPQLLSNLGFEELGRGDIEDFTSGLTDNMNFTDYKAAYTKVNTIEYDERFNRGDYKNLDSLVRARDTQSFVVNEEDRAWMDRRAMMEKQQEEDRIGNMMAFDRMAEQYSSRANMHFIKNK